MLKHSVGTMALVLALLSPALSHADTINLPGTGQNVLSGLDENYQIVSDTTGLYTGAIPGDAAVVTNPPSAWATLPGTQWIGPTANQATIGDTNAGTTTYQTTLSVTDPGNSDLLFSLLVDNNITIFLNGSQVYSEGAGNGLYQGFLSPAYVSISSGFVTGANTLRFVVGNGFGPTGMDIGVTPEPPTVVLTGFGLLALLAVIRKRRFPIICPRGFGGLS